MKKSKVLIIAAVAVCGVLLVSSVIFFSLNPRFFQDRELEASNSKLFAQWVSDANKIIDELDDTEKTGGMSDAYYQAFLHTYGYSINGFNTERLLLPTDDVSIPDKDVLHDKIKRFCESKVREVIAGTYQSLKEQGYIHEERIWSPSYDGLCIRLYSYEGDVAEKKIKIMTGDQAGNSYTFEKKNGAWKLTSLSEWIS